MDIDQIKAPLNQFVKKVPKSIKVDQVIIFGSYLEGNVSQDSDIDVLVISDDFKKMNADQRLEVLYDAAEDIEPEIDAWGFTQEELKRAGELTTLGYARTSGIRFV
jgi:hypothetical protein